MCKNNVLREIISIIGISIGKSKPLIVLYTICIAACINLITSFYFTDFSENQFQKYGVILSASYFLFSSIFALIAESIVSNIERDTEIKDNKTEVYNAAERYGFPVIISFLYFFLAILSLALTKI